MRAVVAAALVAIAAPAVVHAQSWRPIERQCARTINEEYRKAGGHCAGCEGFWPYYAMCTVHYAYGDRRFPPARVKACIAAVERATRTVCNQCADRVDLTIRCLGGS